MVDQVIFAQWTKPHPGLQHWKLASESFASTKIHLHHPPVLKAPELKAEFAPESKDQQSNLLPPRSAYTNHQCSKLFTPKLNLELAPERQKLQNCTILFPPPTELSPDLSIYHKLPCLSNHPGLHWGFISELPPGLEPELLMHDT